MAGAQRAHSPADASQHPLFTRYRWQLFAATWLSYAGFYVTRKVFGIVKAPMKAALGIDDLTLSWIWTAYLLAYMLGMFATAALAQRIKNRTLLIAGMGLSVVVNLAVGCLFAGPGQAYWFLFALMLVHGLAQSTGWPSNAGLLASWTRRWERGTVMGFWGTCYQLGSVFAKGFAAFIFGLSGLVWSYWASSLFLLAVLVLFFFWGRESPDRAGIGSLRDGDARASSAKDTIGVPLPEPEPLSRAALVRMALFMGSVYFTFKFLRYAIDSWSALLIAETFHWDAEAAGYLSTAFDWAGVLGVLMSGFISDRAFRGSRGPVICLMTVGLVLGITFLALFGAQSPLLFGIGLAFMGFMLMGPDALLSATAPMDLGSRHQAATAVAIINGLGSVGPIVQEPVIGWLKTSFGLDGVMIALWGVAIVAFIGTLGVWRLMRPFEKGARN